LRRDLQGVNRGFGDRVKARRELTETRILLRTKLPKNRGEMDL
jgi:hypothetical protein